MTQAIEHGRPSRLATPTLSEKEDGATADLHRRSMEHHFALVGKHSRQHLIEEEVLERLVVQSRLPVNAHGAGLSIDEELGVI
jgi:hypothetical protein